MISSLQLAKLCGVSQGTVDRAMHGRPGISEATRRKILAMAERYGYRPNPAVREIMDRRSHLVGAIIPALNNIFFMDMMSRLKELLAAHQKMLLLTPVHDQEDFTRTLEEFAARKMHAALVVPPEENLVLPSNLTKSLPILSLLSKCKNKAITTLAADDIQAGRMAVQYLANLGHRRILHLTYARKAKGIMDRICGYRAQMKELGLESLVAVYRDEKTFFETVNRYRPSAIFCHNDWLAITILRQVQHRGIKVPEELSILGVDHTPTFQALYPDLSSLEYPLKHFTECAAQWVITGKIHAVSEAFRVFEGKTTCRQK
jgi:DNA-binding LacI/PurR family transcriptional regulator